MNHIYHINHQLDIPIYQQLVDSVRTAIQKGELTAGQKLPTVQELSMQLGVAKGTSKRAYDELEQLGYVEKVQGRGTFVRSRPENGNRKEQAMATIDAMLDKLEDMGFSQTEINIFLNLKLRDREEQQPTVKVAVLECNPENLAHMTEQMRKIPGVDLYSYLLESIEEYPYKLGEDLELIVTTAAHAPYLESVLPESRRLARVALRLKPQCLSEIIKLRKGKRVGILGYSLRFAQLLQRTCQMYTEGVQITQPRVFGEELKLDAYLADKDAVLVPQDFEKYCSPAAAEQLKRYAGQLIECSYEMDEGSFLYLQVKTKRLLEEKTGGNM